MKILWAPWRFEYIESEKPKYCILCKAYNDQDDKQNLVLWRGKHTFIIMNRYPYNSGHLMVAPIRHVSNLDDLTNEEMLEIAKAIKLSLNALKKAMGPHGFNIGMNIGRAAGAGIEEHIHVHIVPRWIGDSNYMPIISNTKVMPEYLSQTYDKLKPYFDEI